MEEKYIDQEPYDKEEIKKQKDINKNHKQVRAIQQFCFNLLIFCIALFLLFRFAFGLTTAPNSDMSPRVDAGDLLLFYRLPTDYRIGDVLVYEKGGTEYVARIVAKGGDKVDITDGGQVSVNGQVIQEQNIYRSTVKYEDYIEYPYAVPSGSYFVLVDMRDSGEDSRCFGAISQSDVSGLVISLLRRSGL